MKSTNQPGPTMWTYTKKTFFVILSSIVFILGFIIGILILVLFNSMDRYNKNLTFDALYNYTPLMENLDFKYLKIAKDKMYYTKEESKEIIVDYIKNGKYPDKVREIIIPPFVQEKTKRIKVYSVEKNGDLIYFTLNKNFRGEAGIIYSKNPNLDCKPLLPKQIRKLTNFHGVGQWYFFAT